MIVDPFEFFSAPKMPEVKLPRSEKRIEALGTMTLEQASKLSRKKFWEEVEHQLSTALNCSVAVSIVEKDGNDE